MREYDLKLLAANAQPISPILGPISRFVVFKAMGGAKEEKCKRRCCTAGGGTFLGIAEKPRKEKEPTKESTRKGRRKGAEKVPMEIMVPPPTCRVALSTRL